MRLRSIFPIASILLTGFASVSAFAQAPGVPVGQNHYAIVQANDGKTVGSADCTVGSLASGYQINSRGDMKLAKFSYEFSNENRLDSQLNSVRDQITGTVNGAAVTFGLESDTTGRLFNVNIQASGKNTTNSFDRHQRSVLMPDLDPAAYIEMAHFALGNPPTAWIVIPKQNGLLVPADYEPKADAHGTLQGQPVLVHHTSVVVSSLNGVTAEIYYTNDGSLMEADLPEQNFFVIHDGFRLDSRPTYQPPRGSTPPPQQGEPQNEQPRQNPQPGQPPQQAKQPPQYSVPPGSPQPQIQPQSF